MTSIGDPSFWQIFTQSTVTTPAHEIMLLLVVVTFCLFAKWTRVGLLVAFVYVYRWGWLFMHQAFDNQPRFLIVYYTAGILVIVASIIAFIMHRE